MLRILGFFVGWLFMLAIYYGAIFPHVGSLFDHLGSAMSAAGPLAGLGLFDKTQETIMLWVPLAMTAGVIILLFIQATGTRGTSFRP